MAKFKKLALCMTILMCFAMATFAGCSFFEQFGSSDTDSSPQIQDSVSDESSGSESDSNSDSDSGSEDSTNGGNWTGEAPID